MKKFTILGLSVIIVVACMLPFWHYVKISRFDRGFRQSLAGIWSRNVGDIRCTNVVAVDGSFTEQVIFNHPDRTNTYEIKGTWHIKGGNLIETVTSDSNKSALTPRTHSGRVVPINTNGFIIAWQGFTNKSVWQRVSP